MADFGHDVVGVDVDESKVKELSAGRAPFFEPGLPELLARVTATGRLQFTTDLAAVRPAGIEDGPIVHFVCVGTPQRKGENAADTTYVDAAVTGLLPHLRPGDLVVGKSTVPVGTAARLAAQIAKAVPGAMLAWNPEFLREGHAVDDTQRPDRLVYGLPAEPEAQAAAKALLDAVYFQPLADQTPLITADYATAELVKAAANAFLATKISFINAMAEVCEAAGGDVTILADAIGHDDRIGRKFLGAGLGFGGGCLPKDIRAFTARAEELGIGSSLNFLREVDEINMRARHRAVAAAKELLGGTFLGRNVAILGAAFKPHSDDIRDSPALNVAAAIKLQGAHVCVHDEEAIDNARAAFPALEYARESLKACEGADVVLHLTEWPQYGALDPVELAKVTNVPRLLEARNTLDIQRWREAGWTVRALGRAA